MWRIEFRGFVFINNPATTEIYTLSLHDALPILVVVLGAAEPVVERPRRGVAQRHLQDGPARPALASPRGGGRGEPGRSEEHKSELQSRQYLVCRLLLEKKSIARENPGPPSPR